MPRSPSAPASTRALFYAGGTDEVGVGVGEGDGDGDGEGEGEGEPDVGGGLGEDCTGEGEWESGRECVAGEDG
jgi:hypothetical protein